jgi:predicted permease
LTRALSREREIAVRVTLGAAPRQLITQLMAESLVLSVCGAIVGIAASAAALPLIKNLTPVQIPRLDEASLDVRALGLCLGVVVVTTVVFGLLPALLLLRTQFTSELKSGERGSSKGGRRIYSLLVASEVALACALLVSSALLVRTVSQLMATPTGVNADSVVTTTVQLTPNVNQKMNFEQFRDEWVKTGHLHTQIVEEIRQQPGVLAVGHTNFLPLEVGWRNPFIVRGEARPARQEDLPQAQLISVSDGYFEAMGARLVAGRLFTPQDGADSAGVVIVNESFAKRHLANKQPVGETLLSWATGIGPLGVNLKAPSFNASQLHDGMTFDVVGVVADVRNTPLGQALEPAIYFTTRQFPFAEVFLTVRGVDPSAAQTAVRNAMRKVTPTVPMGATRTWGEKFSGRTAEARLLMTVLVFFGGLAGLLAALGVYGLFSWSVALRTRELAIRLTLGAKPAEVGALVVRQSAVLIVTGLAVGFAIVRLAESILTRVLFNVSPSDATAIASAAALLLVAALVACLPPALRAMRVDPVEGLRAE